jgi:flagellar FliJ protein
MDKSRRLAPVVQVTESRERKAAREFGECQRRLSEQQHQLQQLKNYHLEYQRQLEARGRTGIVVAQVLETQRFLLQLDKAIAQQQQVVEQTARLCHQKRHLWLKARTRSEAVNKAVERLADEEQRSTDKREQKESDELALRKRGGGAD